MSESKKVMPVFWAMEISYSRKLDDQNVPLNVAFEGYNWITLQ